MTRQEALRESPTHRIRTHCRQANSRLKVLATPKGSKATWLTAFGPRIVWGNQQSLRPVSAAAMRHIPSQRLNQLATPKNNFTRTGMLIPEFQYSCGRESCIWPRPATSAPATSRIVSLAQHKTVPGLYLEQHYQSTMSCGRVSPIWRPSSSALTCGSRPRTQQLSRPKTTHPLYTPSRGVQTIVPETAKQYVTTPETTSLAQPKLRKDGPFRDPQWPVPAGPREAEATPRQLELARPKRLSEGYECSRDVIWRVGTGARNAVASSRLCELASPIVRDTMDHVQFNPEAFNVSPAAKKAKASSRIEELAQPIQRGGS